MANSVFLVLSFTSFVIGYSTHNNLWLDLGFFGAISNQFYMIVFTVLYRPLTDMTANAAAILGVYTISSTFATLLIT